MLEQGTMGPDICAMNRTCNGCMLIYIFVYPEWGYFVSVASEVIDFNKDDPSSVMRLDSTDIPRVWIF